MFLLVRMALLKWPVCFPGLWKGLITRKVSKNKQLI
jgi:hypothetical protein